MDSTLLSSAPNQLRMAIRGALARSAGRLMQEPRGARAMSGGGSSEQELKEMNRWRAITLAALPVVAGACTWVLCFKDWLTWSLDGMYASCAVVYAYWTDMRRLAAFVQEKEEHQEPPPYEHLRIRTKPLFPWYASVTRSSGRTQAQLPSHLRATLSLSAVPEGTPPSNRGCKLYCYSTCSEARWWQNVATPSVA